MRKYFVALLSVAVWVVLGSSIVCAQNARPVGMQYVGSQDYSGRAVSVVNPQQQNVRKVAPTINSVYATPMQRVNEIPLYGKNKSVYFYGQPKKDEGAFAGTGLYMFADFSTGKTDKGVNLEHGEIGNGESDANNDMGTANGISLGVGRVMSNTLSVEFMYSMYNGMKYGNWVKFNSTKEAEVDEEADDEEEEPEEIPIVDDFTYEVISGGQIDSQFIGLGFKYNLERTFGTLMGRFKPYIGFQLGVAQNTIKDYIVSDPDGYAEGDDLPTDEDDVAAAVDELGVGEYSSEAYSNGELQFIGSSTRSFAAGIEAGLTFELEGNLSIDIFYRMNRYGKVKTSGNMLSTYDIETTDFYITDEEDAVCDDGFGQVDLGEEYAGDYTLCMSEDPDVEEGVQSLSQRRVLSGDMTFRQYGIKLKYMF